MIYLQLYQTARKRIYYVVNEQEILISETVGDMKRA